LLRNMAQNLIEHGRITTTLAKAKTLRPFFEKLVTLAVRTRELSAADDKAGALRARRRIDKLLTDRGMIPRDYRDTYAEMSDAARKRTLRMVSGRRYRTGEPKGRLTFTAESVTHRLIEAIAPRYEDRPGGYTRLVRLPARRIGDASHLAIVQLVGDEEAPGSLTKPGKSARRRRADARYSLAVQTAKRRAGRTRAESRADTGSTVTDDAEPESTSKDEGLDKDAEAQTD
jgi:large subunit ribosomal protein L17